MEINTSVVFESNYEALFLSDKRFIVNQGGSRSSKTYSLCQLVIIYALTNPNKVISIIRKTFPSLRATVMRDFFEVMKELDLYNQKNHNKTENIYIFDNGTMVEFFSTDTEQKIRGRKRDLCWVNEANELFHDDFVQLNMRTVGKFIVDYNPSDASSWIYELPEDNKIIIKSTYKDNPFIEESIIQQIEGLKDTDEALYQIYALGERTASRINVYQNWNFVDEKPAYFTEYVYGIDFGWNHPISLNKVWYYEKELFIETLIYESYMDQDALVDRMNTLGVDKGIEILADHARPDIIHHLRMADFNVHEADKSVKKGITNMKTFKIYAYNTDKTLIKEFENYSWKKVGDKITDEVVKLYDDSMDACRYATTFIQDHFVGGSPLISF